MGERRARPGIFGPLLLIFLGVIFLLNNLDIIQWSVWDLILRFWPVLLIAAGLDLILGQRSAWGSAVALILVLAVIGGGIVLLGEPDGTSAESRQVAISGAGADRVDLVLDPAIGYLQLSPGQPGQTDLLQGRLASGRGEQIEQRQDETGNQLDIVIRTRSWSVVPFITISFSRPGWDLELRPGTDLDLDVDLGIGKAEVDLRQQKTAEVRVHTGVGEAQVVLPEHGGQVSVEVGIGQLTIELPSSAGVRIQVETGIGSTVIPPGFTRRDGSYFSPGYEQAEEKIDLILDMGIGTILVR